MNRLLWYVVKKLDFVIQDSLDYVWFPVVEAVS